MPLLEHGRPVEDAYVPVADDAPLPPDRPALISFARLQRETNLPDGSGGRGGADVTPRGNDRLGIQVASATRPDDIAPFLDRVTLVAIEFPKFRDGRGFTIARTLRERYGYTGELRAVGHILPDQYEFLVRCGFTSVAVPDDADLGVWSAALDRFHVAYQAGVDTAPVVSGLRRRLALGGAR
jgi:uncharacterized protein (DUF934 family)